MSETSPPPVGLADREVGGGFRGLCRGRHELFDSPEVRDWLLARQFCLDCPVYVWCAEHLPGHLDHADGTWAGVLFSNGRRVDVASTQWAYLEGWYEAMRDERLLPRSPREEGAA